MQINNFYNKNISWIYVDKDNEVKYCPLKRVNAKLLHPRVVLKFKKNQANCPYCGMKYKYRSE